MAKREIGRPLGVILTGRREGMTRLSAIYITHAQQVCGDCGKLGCLIPVTHTAPEQRTGDETI
jgi:hypothetical protein